MTNDCEEWDVSDCEAYGEHSSAWMVHQYEWQFPWQAPNECQCWMQHLPVSLWPSVCVGKSSFFCYAKFVSLVGGESTVCATNEMMMCYVLSVELHRALEATVTGPAWLPPSAQGPTSALGLTEQGLDQQARTSSPTVLPSLRPCRAWGLPAPCYAAQSWVSGCRLSQEFKHLAYLTCIKPAWIVGSRSYSTPPNAALWMWWQREIGWRLWCLVCCCDCPGNSWAGKQTLVVCIRQWGNSWLEAAVLNW